MSEKTVAEQLMALLNEYSRELTEVVEDAAEKTANETKDLLRQSSPKGKSRRHYASGWAVKIEKIPGGGINTTIYNRTKPQLTHLLEKGHAIKNQYGGHGRVAAIPHIGPAEEKGIAAFLARIEGNL